MGEYEDVREGVVLTDRVRLPKVLFDYGININGWHEVNALMDHIWEEVNKLRSMGLEKYMGQFFYKEGQGFVLPSVTSYHPLRADGLQELCKQFLVDKLKTINSVLDVGCGQGQAGIWFSTAGKKYVGIDVALVNIGFSYAMLPCFKYLMRDSCPQPEYKVMLAEDLKFKDKEFDLVFASHSLEHSHDIDLVFREQARVGKCLCGVVPFPQPDESGAHMFKLPEPELRKHLEKVCLEFVIKPTDREHIYWGTTK